MISRCGGLSPSTILKNIFKYLGSTVESPPQAHLGRGFSSIDPNFGTLPLPIKICLLFFVLLFCFVFLLFFLGGFVFCWFFLFVCLFLLFLGLFLFCFFLFLLYCVWFDFINLKSQNKIKFNLIQFFFNSSCLPVAEKRACVQI